MLISFSETYPIIEEYCKRIVATRKYCDKVNFGKSLLNSDLAVFDEKYPNFLEVSENTPVFAPSDAVLPRTAHCKTLLLGGMKQNDEVTFSSIGENSAFICLQKEFNFNGKDILPFEKKVLFDRSYGIYKNLSVGLIISLLDIYFGEENGKNHCKFGSN